MRRSPRSDRLSRLPLPFPSGHPGSCKSGDGGSPNFQNSQNEARMFMKTKDRGLERTLHLNVGDAPESQVGQIVPLGLISPFGTSEILQIGRLRQSELSKLAERSQNVYENKGK